MTVSVYERVAVEGQCGIKAMVERHSKAFYSGIEMLTYVIEYPRLVLAELNTHKMLSKNSSSSRAIPWPKMKEQLSGRPLRFGEANKGMQDKGESHNALLGAGYTPEQWWELAKKSATAFAEEMFDKGYHKQIGNRLTEPFQCMRTVISGTEWNNFFWLRNHEAADPTLQELARVMWEAKQQSKPQMLMPGHWHLPFVELFIDEFGYEQYGIERTDGLSGYHWLSLEEAQQVSAARAAAVSFRNVDYGVDKSREVYARLVGDERKHASAFEHQATPMDKLQDSFVCVNVPEWPKSWQPGVSHTDREGNLWSGNLKGFIQFRKLIPGECMPG